MTETQRAMLLLLLSEGECNHFWVTRNYLVQNENGQDWVRLMYPDKPGEARLETGKEQIIHQPVDFLQWEAVGPRLYESRPTYTTECAEHFVNRIIRFT